MEAFANIDMSYYIEENIDKSNMFEVNRAKWIRATYKYIVYKSIEKRNPGEIINPFSKTLLSKISEQDLAGKIISYDQLGDILEKIH